MIHENKPLSIVEACEILKNMEIDEERKKDIETFLKKFTKISFEKAKELRKEIEALGIIKIKPQHISQIIDIMPEDASELNKIFTETTLNEDETNKILEIIKKYR